MATNDGIDKPKSLRNADEIQSRLAGIFDTHMSSLTRFVQTIRKETGLDREIPYFDPLDGGINAKCLFLFEAPGRRAVLSGFISRNNPDETAKNFFELNHQAGLPRELTISWNVVPWYIGTGNKIRRANEDDIARGKAYLGDLVSLLPNLRIIVLAGKKAQKAETSMAPACPGVTLMKMPHPSPLYVNRAPDNRFNILRILQAVKERLVVY